MLKNKLTVEDINLKDSVYKRITNPFYVIIVALTTICTYGFYLARPSPSADWLSYDEYYNGMLFGQGRFTATIIEKVLGLWNCPVWFEPLLGLVCFILGTLVILAVFDGFAEYKSIVPSIAFTCIYITFPLLPEYFIYNGAILTVGGSTLLLALALYLEIKYKDFLRSALIPVILMIIVVSWYECMILPYIGVVFGIFFLLNRNSHNLKTKFVITKGLYFALILVAAIILEYVITTGIIKIFSIPIDSHASLQTNWRATPKSFLILLASYAAFWCLKFFCYPAFTILFIFLFIFLIMMIVELVKYKKFSSVIIYLGMLLTVFSMTLIRCGGSHYRIEQGMPFFVAFIVYLFCLDIKNKKTAIRHIFSAVMVFLLIIQIGSTNYSYFINNQRYEEDKNVILTVHSIVSADCDLNKPVVFIGDYIPTENIRNKTSYSEDSIAGKLTSFAAEKSPVYKDKLQEMAQNREIYNFGSSYLEWSIIYPLDTEHPLSELYKFCNYIGISYKHCTKAQFEDANERYADLPSYPNKGCIAENEEYIVVKLGKVEIQK